MIASTLHSVYADTRQVARIIWHRLTRPGCGPDCRSVCVEDMHRAAYERIQTRRTELVRSGGGVGLPLLPEVGALPRPVERVVAAAHRSTPNYQRSA